MLQKLWVLAEILNYWLCIQYMIWQHLPRLCLKEQLNKIHPLKFSWLLQVHHSLHTLGFSKPDMVRDVGKSVETLNNFRAEDTCKQWNMAVHITNVSLAFSFKEYP